MANVKGRPPRIFGISVSYVPTTSMEPEILAGDYVIFKSINYDDVKVGDIVVYLNADEDKYIIHRVVEDYGSYLITKGDNNALKDTYKVTKDNLYGKYIGKAGILSIFAGGINKIVLGIVLFLLIMGFLVLQIVSFVMKAKKDKLEEEQEKIKNELKEEMRKELIEEIINSTKKDDSIDSNKDADTK